MAAHSLSLCGITEVGTKGLSAPAARHNLQSREAVPKDSLGRMKTQLEILLPISVMQSRRLQPGCWDLARKSPACSLTREVGSSAGFLARHDARCPEQYPVSTCLCSCLQTFEGCIISPSAIVLQRMDTRPLPSPRVRLLSL